MEVLCLGLMVCDVLVKPVEAWLFSRDSARVDCVKMGSGGDALNAAVNLAALGISTGMAGKVGRDGFGQFLLDCAAASGVDTANVVVSDTEGTSACVVLIGRDGERHFAYHGGANDTLSLEDINLSVVGIAPILYVGSAFELPGLDGGDMTRLLRHARNHGSRTVLDVTGNPDARRLDALAGMLPHVDFFMPSLQEAAAITGQSDIAKAAEVFRGMGASTVVIKNGRDGCHVHSGQTAFSVPAFMVEAIDTTGCGDAFVAGFMAAHARGMDLKCCARMANAAGALCATMVGATAWARPFDEVVNWMVEARTVPATFEP
jgi:sugar/nucleoside kinase (ribokinase family)